MKNAENTQIIETKKPTLVIRTNIMLNNQEYHNLRKIIYNQFNNGVVVLPPYCEPIYIPEGVEVNFKEDL